MSNTRTANGTPLQIADLLTQITPLMRSHPVCLRGDLRAVFDDCEHQLGDAFSELEKARRRLDDARAAVRRGDSEDTPLDQSGADVFALEHAVAVFEACQERYDHAEKALSDVQAEMRAAVVKFRVKGYPGGNDGLMALGDAHRDPEKPLYVQEVETVNGQKRPTGRAMLDAANEPVQMVDFRGKKLFDLDDDYTPELWAACLVEPECDVEQARQLISLLGDVTRSEITNLITQVTRAAMTVPTSLMLSPSTGASEQS